MLARAAAETGGVATQNRGTLGGNIANASPAADSPPALLVYDAELELISVRGSRRVPYDRFHTGYKKMDLAADEIIRSITIPRGRRGWIESYRKVGTRKAQAISKICFAAAADLDGGVVRDVRLALGSVAPTVVRCAHAEAALRGRTLDGRGGRRRASGAGPRHRADRRHPLDRALSAARRGESPDTVPEGDASAQSSPEGLRNDRFAAVAGAGPALPGVLRRDPWSARSDGRRFCRQHIVALVANAQEPPSRHGTIERSHRRRAREGRPEPRPDPRRHLRVHRRARGQARSVGQRHHHHPGGTRPHQSPRGRTHAIDRLHARQPRGDPRRSRRHRPAVRHRGHQAAAGQAARVSRGAVRRRVAPQGRRSACSRSAARSRSRSRSRWGSSATPR